MKPYITLPLAIILAISGMIWVSFIFHIAFGTSDLTGWPYLARLLCGMIVGGFAGKVCADITVFDSNYDDSVNRIKEQTQKASKFMSKIKRKIKKLESELNRMTKDK
jgi:hypothetical protein